MRILGALLLCWLLLVSTHSYAQIARSDSLRFYFLEPIVVTADRSGNPLSLATSAAAVLYWKDVRNLPVSTVTDALRTTPGIMFVDRDGLGHDPIPVVRGFYGGGEAEYVLVLLDGEPLNRAGSGLVNWSEVPLSSVESLEVVRGGTSSLYGDAAVGGVINLRTNLAVARATHLAISGGGFGSLNAQFRTGGAWGGRRVRLFMEGDRRDGFREHAEGHFETVGGSVALLESRGASIILSTIHHLDTVEEPGPLSGADLDMSRSKSASFYRFDKSTEKEHRARLAGRFRVGEGKDLSMSLGIASGRSDAVRTLLLSSEFADTKNRDLSRARIMGSAQLTLESLPIPFADRLIAGLDLDYSSVSSEYFQFFSGNISEYTAAAASRGELDSSGEGHRRTVAVFVQQDLSPARDLRISLGGRYDDLRNSYDRLPPGGEKRFSSTHAEFSPKVGVNYRYIKSASHVGNVYGVFSRSFKAPTLDQSYDQRNIPIRFPPYSISLSNDELEPQIGTAAELGIYHSFSPAQGLTGAMTLAVYSMDMKNEIDFDLAQYRFGNIGKSRHRGIESGMNLSVGDAWSTFINYTWQTVRSRSGGNDGMFLKAVPRDMLVGGMSASLSCGIGGSLVIESVRGVYLDDLNTLELDDYSVVDTKLVYRRKTYEAAFEIHNLFDQRYATTGFPDPSGDSDSVYLFPAAGRTLRFGLSIDL